MTVRRKLVLGRRVPLTSSSTSGRMIEMVLHVSTVSLHDLPAIVPVRVSLSAVLRTDPALNDDD